MVLTAHFLIEQSHYTAVRNLMEVLSGRDIDRVIEMAWEDRTPFEAIEVQFDLKEQQVIELLRREMKASSWKMWRERVQGRSSKHQKKRGYDRTNHKCSRQKSISNNKISKR